MFRTGLCLQVFYPFVLFYMIAAFLQGGAGTASMGMLNNLRQFLWIPITQNAFRFVRMHQQSMHPPSVCLSVSVCPSVHLSVCLSVTVCLSILLSVCANGQQCISSASKGQAPWQLSTCYYVY